MEWVSNSQWNETGCCCVNCREFYNLTWNIVDYPNYYCCARASAKRKKITWLQNKHGICIDSQYVFCEIEERALVSVFHTQTQEFNEMLRSDATNAFAIQKEKIFIPWNYNNNNNAWKYTWPQMENCSGRRRERTSHNTCYIDTHIRLHIFRNL